MKYTSNNRFGKRSFPNKVASALVVLSVTAAMVGYIVLKSRGSSASVASSGTNATLASNVSMTPNGLAVDSSGNVYISDMANYVVYKVTPSGTISTVAGIPGVRGDSMDGSARASTLSLPSGLALDSSGNLFIGDAGLDNVVDEVSPSGSLSIISGVPGQVNPPDSTLPALSSDLHEPNGLAVDSSGNLYIADTLHSVIEKQKLIGGSFSIVAGLSSTISGPTVNVPASQSGLYFPDAVAVDSTGNLFIADTNNHVIEELSKSTGELTIVAGVVGAIGSPVSGVLASGDQIGNPTGIALDNSGNLFIADAFNNVIEEVSASTGKLTIVAGIPGSKGAPTPGTATKSLLSAPDDVAVDSSGNLYISDSGNNLVERVVLATDQLGFFAGTGQAVAPSPSGIVRQGYWLTASDGGVFSFGDANFYGSLAATKLNAPVVGITPTPDGKGYWLTASDGGVFSFGDANFYGSLAATKLNAPVVGGVAG